MTDTAQLSGAAENVGSLDEAANAFKVHLGQSQAPERPRDEQGRFASQQSEDEEIEAEALPEEGAEAVENDETTEGQEEAAEEAQPTPVDPPASWSKDDAELWSSLPAEAQAKIAEREAQRDAAVNLKFQEAANVKKANEALITEAQTNRTKYAEAVDQVLTLIQPTRPNPQEYFTEQGFDQASYAIAQHQYEQMNELVQGLAQQRQELAAQQTREAEEAEAQALAAINQAAAPRFVADAPELTDQTKAPAIINSIVQYAISQGIPEDVFRPENMKRVSLAELHLAWKASKYDEMKAAQAKVASTPKPEAKKPSPPVKPGVSTPRVAAERARLSGAMDRLGKSGSIEDGAAVLRHLFKGR